MSQLRQALAAHLGQVLTPEVAAGIEGAAHKRTEQPMELLDKWRHLIKPVITQEPGAVSWEELKTIPVQVYEADQSVLVARMDTPVAFIWVAAGVLEEVLNLIERVIADARAAGCHAVSYLGRRGWLGAAGFKEFAVYGMKGI